MDSIVYCVASACTCMLMSVIRPFFYVFQFDRYNNKASKNCFFCLQYPVHDLTLDVVLRLSFAASICYLCVIVYYFAANVVVKNRMNERL